MQKAERARSIPTILIPTFVSPKCGRECASRIGLYSHQRAREDWPSTFPTILVCKEWATINLLWLNGLKAPTNWLTNCNTHSTPLHILLNNLWNTHSTPSHIWSQCLQHPLYTITHMIILSAAPTLHHHRYDHIVCNTHSTPSHILL